MTDVVVEMTITVVPARSAVPGPGVRKVRPGRSTRACRFTFTRTRTVRAGEILG